MAKRARTRGDARLGQEDWERAALEAIAAGGLEAVAVEPLARQLGVTKGSFYWHFASREELITAALAQWETRQTEQVIIGLSQVADPRDRLARLIADAHAATDAARFHAALAAAADHPLVQPVLARVTARRIEFLVECFAAIGLPPATARRRALWAYASYVGLLHLSIEAPDELPQGRARAAYIDQVLAGLLA